MRTAIVTDVRQEGGAVVVTLRKNPWVPYRVWKETMDEMERLIEEEGSHERRMQDETLPQ